MKKRLINSLLILFSLFFINPCIVKAAYANFGATGGTVIVGQEVTATFTLNGVDAGQRLVAVGGYVNFDSNYLDIVGCNGIMTYSPGNKKFAYMDLSGNGITSGNIGTCTFRTKNIGNTSVSFKIDEALNQDNVNFSYQSAVSASITIKPQPSSNNNLSSLNVTPGGINFNGGTSYSIDVGENVTSVNVSATAEDSKSSISGIGTHNLNYGSNTINVVVTAENGNQKAYVIRVNRKDNRSSNNNLASLSVNDGKLNPGFGKNTTKYTMEVPYSTSKLKLSATAEDAKAKVSISNPDLVAEEVTDVKITVTAENGGIKTYIISVKRGKDPNKKLSNNNYLSNMSVSIGMLSPAFNKDKLNYAVYLPYEVSEINIDSLVEDTKYATIEKEGNSYLSVGNNLFKYTVTAEDGSKRTYTITVVRNESLDKDGKVLNDNVYLKKLTLQNGKLATKFKKDKFIYNYYKNGKTDIKDAVPEIDGNKVEIEKMDGAFIVIVESASGAKGFYVLIEKSNMTWLHVLLIIAVFALIIFGLFFKFKKRKRNKRNKEDIENLEDGKKKRRKLKRNKEK